MSTASPVRLRTFQLALSALCAASIVQSLIGFVWPQVISESPASELPAGVAHA